MPELAVIYRKVAELVPYGRNARTHSDAQIAQIAQAIQTFGWTNPVLVDESSRLIAGHGRVAAASLLGLADVPTICIEGLTDAQRRALIIADNKLALNAGWNDALLATELQTLRAEDFDIGVIGFGQDELQRLLPNGGGLTDPDDAPPLPADPVSALGDVWLLGRHRLVCGDCTERDVVARALGEGPAPRLMVTDPPYGVNYDPKWRMAAGVGSKGAATGLVMNDHRADWRAAWALFPGSVAYVWHGGLHAGLVAESLASCRIAIRAQIIWVKTRPALSRGHYHWQHEPALYGVRDGNDDEWRFVPEHEVLGYAVKDGETAGWHGGRKQSTVWFIEHLKSDTGHGTQKPIECMRRPIENNSAPGHGVYDPFLGSGTTLIAAEMTGRACHACELNPGYVDVCVKRWQTFTGKKAMHEETGETFDAVAEKRLPVAA